MRAYLIDNESPRIIEIDDNLDVYYEMIDCRCIDIVMRKIGGKYYNIVCDDEGLLVGKRISALSKNGEPMLVGNLIICNNDGAELASLDDEDVQNIEKYIAQAMFNDGSVGYIVTSMDY